MQVRSKAPTVPRGGRQPVAASVAGNVGAGKGGGQVIALHAYRVHALEAAVAKTRKRLHRLARLRFRAELSAGRLQRELMELERDLRDCRRYAEDGRDPPVRHAQQAECRFERWGKVVRCLTKMAG